MHKTLAHLDEPVKPAPPEGGRAIKLRMPGIDDLPGLAEQIREEHRECDAAARGAVQHAIRAGELLLDAKEQCKHGTWKRWIEEHCGFSLRTAQLYMKVATDVPALPDEKRNAVALLPSLRGIERELRQDQRREEVHRERTPAPTTIIIKEDEVEVESLPRDPARQAAEFVAQAVHQWGFEIGGEHDRELGEAMLSAGCDLAEGFEPTTEDDADADLCRARALIMAQFDRCTSREQAAFMIGKVAYWALELESYLPGRFDEGGGS